MHKRGSKKRQANEFTPEVEDKEIREEISHKLYRTLVNPSNKVWRDSTQTKSN